MQVPLLTVGLALLMVVSQGGIADPSGAPGAGPDQRPQMEGLQSSGSGPLEDPVLEARATALADELRCPVCQGLSIHDSPSPLAQDMKDLIRSRVAAGATDDEVRAYFVSRYGEWVLLEPEASGFNLLVYLLPAIALLGGAGFVLAAVRRWTRRDGGEAAAGG